MTFITENEELVGLAAACEAATFGRDQQNVLDETYRKAGKLDKNSFALNFDPSSESYGLLGEIQDILLEGHSADAAIHYDLYKLNVYGE